MGKISFNKDLLKLRIYELEKHSSVKFLLGTIEAEPGHGSTPNKLIDEYADKILERELTEQYQLLGFTGTRLRETVHIEFNRLSTLRRDANERMWQSEKDRIPVNTIEYEWHEDTNGELHLWYRETEEFVYKFYEHAKEYDETVGRDGTYNPQEHKSFLEIEKNLREGLANSALAGVHDKTRLSRYFQQFHADGDIVKMSYIDIGIGSGRDLKADEARSVIINFANEDHSTTLHGTQENGFVYILAKNGPVHTDIIREAAALKVLVADSFTKTEVRFANKTNYHVPYSFQPDIYPNVSIPFETWQQLPVSVPVQDHRNISDMNPPQEVILPTLMIGEILSRKKSLKNTKEASPSFVERVLEVVASEKDKRTPRTQQQKETSNVQEQGIHLSEVLPERQESEAVEKVDFALTLENSVTILNHNIDPSELAYDYAIDETKTNIIVEQTVNETLEILLDEIIERVEESNLALEVVGIKQSVALATVATSDSILPLAAFHLMETGIEPLVEDTIQNLPENFLDDIVLLNQEGKVIVFEKKEEKIQQVARILEVFLDNSEYIQYRIDQSEVTLAIIPLIAEQPELMGGVIGSLSLLQEPIIITQISEPVFDVDSIPEVTNEQIEIVLNILSELLPIIDNDIQTTDQVQLPEVIKETPLPKSTLIEGREHGISIETQKKTFITSPEEQKKEVEKITAKFSLSVGIFMLLQITEEIKKRDQQKNTKENKKKEQQSSDYETNWLLLSIIWYMSQIREQGIMGLMVGNQAAGKQTIKDKKKRTKYTVFPQSGIIFMISLAYE